ncbi:hypothetical protein [Actinomadura sp. 6N118]|uniref:hypothetical protein n=1 Tax=Actinomadura sp. 6N118 TaxID=3375151 RepID=UPI00379BB8D9
MVEGDWDGDSLNAVTGERWSRRFKISVRILLVPVTAWMAWSLHEYLSHGGLKLNYDDPHYFSSLTFATIIFLTLLALEILKPLDRTDSRSVRMRLGFVSAFTSLLCLAGIAFAWTMVYGKASEQSAVGSIVTNDQATQRYLTEHLPQHGAGYTKVPTGVFIQSVEFKGASNVTLSGYVWQRIPREARVKPGVIFPEAGDAYAATEKLVYQHDEGDHRLMGWYFYAEFRQLFDYGSYPLDKQNVWLRMWGVDFQQRVVLTPDFAGYPPWKIRNMTAMDAKMVYGEWNPDFTAYSYLSNPYTTNFGFARPAGISNSNTPELYFNLGLKRDPQGPLYGSLIRWSFIALVVFFAMFLITIDEERRELVGFSTFQVMSFAVGMLLVIVFDQNAIREATEAKGTVYLEYFSYALYLMILFVSLNAMMVTANIRIRALTWGANLLPKLVYWPGYLGLVLAATLLVFF